MILGIYHPANGVGHDTGVALVRRDGAIVAAMSEERLSRVKMDGGFPFRALEAVLRMGNVRPSDLDAVAVPYLDTRGQIAEGARLAARALRDPALFAGQLALRRGRDRFQAGMRALGAYEYVDDLKAASSAPPASAPSRSCRSITTPRTRPAHGSPRARPMRCS
jgi:predicted NodU family carbamoyl transferase